MQNPVRQQPGHRQQLPRRYLDAAHGETHRTVVAVQRIDEPRAEVERPRIAIARRLRRGGPPPSAVVAQQVSRRMVAVARSRRCVAIAEWNAAESAEQWFSERMSMRLLRPEFRAQPAGHACGPPLRETAARTARRVEQRRQQIVHPDRLRPESKPFVILNEVKNLFPCEPKAADGLCLARRRKTNAVQSNICIVSIQILRRYAPQNDKLFLNCAL